MSCNPQIHDELKNIGESKCPFCDKFLLECDKGVQSCCSNQHVESLICVNCGLVFGCEYATEYIDFYENIHKIRRKSVYHRKYHIENVPNTICYVNRVELTHDQRDQIYKIFLEIGTILNEVNGIRKRMISVNFIMRRIFEMMEISYKQIPITK